MDFKSQIANFKLNFQSLPALYHIRFRACGRSVRLEAEQVKSKI
jgi:hypothetical protein